MMLLPGHSCTEDSLWHPLFTGGSLTEAEWLHIEQYNCGLLIFCTDNCGIQGSCSFPGFSRINPGPHGDYVSTTYMCSVRNDSCSFLVERMWGQFPGLQIKYVMCTPLSCFLLQVFIQYSCHWWGKIGIKQFQIVEKQGLVYLALVQLRYWNSSLYKRGKENNFFEIEERQLQVKCIPSQCKLSQWYVLIIWKYIHISSTQQFSFF